MSNFLAREYWLYRLVGGACFIFFDFFEEFLKIPAQILVITWPVSVHQ